MEVETYGSAVCLVNRLIKLGYKIAVAESCTGGKLAAAIIDVPDASRVLDMSIVTYANEAKIRYLGVDKAVIEDKGVVSTEVAAMMASGIAREAGADVGVGISGIAGPKGGSRDKPVGTVCFGYYIAGELSSERINFDENLNRNKIRDLSTAHALSTVLKKLT